MRKKGIGRMESEGARAFALFVEHGARKLSIAARRCPDASGRSARRRLTRAAGKKEGRKRKGEEGIFEAGARVDAQAV